MAALFNGGRLGPSEILSIVSKSSIGSVSLLSSAAAPAAISKRGDGHQLGQFLPTSIILPQTNKHNVNNTESLMLRAAIQDLKKEEKNINSLEKMLESLRIARVLPTKSTKTKTTLVLPTKQQSDEQQHTFQAMNRNARKAKRANHGKRPCSRIRRRYKVKKWANTSRRG